MSRTKIIILLACILSMGAGVEVGMLRSRVTPTKGEDKASWLAKELELTPQQREQMEAIWKEMVRSRGPEFANQMRTLQEEREAAIAGLMNSEQKDQYEKINAQFMERMQKLWKQAEQDFRAAAEKTRQLLNESQRERYDVLLKAFEEQHNGGDWFGMGRSGRGPSSSPGGRHGPPEGLR